MSTGPWIRNTLKADKAEEREQALSDIYRVMRPGEPPTVESAKAYFRNAFFESRRYDLSRVGRYKLNARLDLDIQAPSYQAPNAAVAVAAAAYSAGAPATDFPLSFYLSRDQAFDPGLDPAVAKGRRPQEFSGGQCQRISIARALSSAFQCRALRFGQLAM